jgi:hypothetical protein
MDWHALSPYLFPLLIAALLLRRTLRAQKARTVRMTRLWLFPILLLLTTAMSLAKEPSPGILVVIAFVVACLAGGAIGWYRVHTLEFSLDTESGKVSARATRLGALLIVGLIALRYLADLAMRKLGLTTGANLVRASDATLIFSTSMFVARSAHTWIRARALLAAHRGEAVTDQSGASPTRPNVP